MKILPVSLLLILLALKASYAQLPLSQDTVEHLLTTSPAFTIYKDNYFITGTTLREQISKDNSDAKFHFSFKQRVMNRPLPLGAYLYLIYSQKSFWNIYKMSSPFAETNYNPGVQLLKPFFMNEKLMGGLALSIEHESNGRDSIYSRSWNYASVAYTQFISRNLNVTLKAWLPFMLNDNPDLIYYIGYGEGQLQWTIKEDKLLLNLRAQKGASLDWRGSFEANLSFKPFKSRNQYFMLQWWQGYAESLVNYRQSTSKLRVGLALKPAFYKFY